MRPVYTALWAVAVLLLAGGVIALLFEIFKGFRKPKRR
jgi:hypothetical protein